MHASEEGACAREKETAAHTRNGDTDEMNDFIMHGWKWWCFLPLLHRICMIWPRCSWVHADIHLNIPFMSKTYSLRMH